ncbi:polyprenyl synthetase family protein [Gammaproteobacteria bacterium]|nr:polyprenyl synthetase family protein [Gammaproteobacteria bacterium]MDA9112912.1 polyprenyl synthetase family protein [Gammaproteobacteria bacterium]
MKLIDKSYETELKLVNKLIKDEIINETVIQELYDYIFKKNGKQLRPLLSLISSSADKRKNSKRVQVAAIIELLHTATLVHDDVVDESPLRRGVETINNFWTNSHGVLMGDFIYSKAFMLMVDISNIDILNELSKATNDISKGELIQLNLIGKEDISLNQLKKVSYYKTGRLFEASAKCGAILVAKSDQKYINNISDFAKNLGIAFQIKDDMLDYSSNAKRLGKPILQDLREGKITYPFYFAMQKADLKDKKYLLSILGLKNKTSVSKVLKKIELLGGIRETEVLLKSYIDKSIQLANKIDNKKIREEMLNLTKFSYERTK